MNTPSEDFAKQIEEVREWLKLPKNATAWQVMNAVANHERSTTEAFCEIANAFGFDVQPHR